MERLFYFLVICFLNSNNLNCQFSERKNYVINYQWINFVTKDTIYPFTLFIEQNGLYHFEKGFADSSNINRGIFIQNIDKKNVAYERNFCFIPEVEKICTYFNTFEEKINPKIFLELSYLFKKIKEEQNDTSISMVKIIFPCENINFYNEVYFFEIKDKNDEPSLSVLKFRSDDIRGIKLVHKEVFALKNKDIFKVKKKIKNIENINNITCTNSLKPYFIEYSENSRFGRHIFTSYCIDKRKSQEEVLKFYYWFLGIARSYIDLDCSRELKNQVPKSF